MRKTWTLLAVVLAALVLGACRSVPIQNYDQVAITRYDGASLTLDNVGQAIAIGAAQKGWETDFKEPGHVVATLTLREHQALVDINFSTNAYSIHYKSSKDLLYDGKGNIHRRYNTWVLNLTQAINAALQKVEPNA